MPMHMNKHSSSLKKQMSSQGLDLSKVGVEHSPLPGIYNVAIVGIIEIVVGNGNMMRIAAGKAGAGFMGSNG